MSSNPVQEVHDLWDLVRDGGELADTVCLELHDPHSDAAGHICTSSIDHLDAESVHHCPCGAIWSSKSVDDVLADHERKA